ncbi:MAG: response regulator [Deferrisomatales bacterium]
MADILIVDDSAWARALVRQALEAAGVEGQRLREAADGASALEAIAVAPPALLVLDLVLPGLSGEDVLRRAREAGYRGAAVVLSADIQDASREALEALGIEAYLVKPVQGEPAERLAAIAREVLGRAADG